MASKFELPITAEKRYAAALRKAARIVAGIIRTHTDGPNIRNATQMTAALEAYSESLEPWAEEISAEMVKSVENKNKRAFNAASKKIGDELKGAIAESLTGEVVRQLQREQVELIKSLPIEAGIRAQKLALEGAVTGTRAAETAKELARTEKVTLSRATLIARTETAKANSAITQARARAVGADTYIWRIVGDGDTRPSHRKMKNTVHRFDQPPTLEDGMTGNAGEFPNCRCYPEPIIPE